MPIYEYECQQGHVMQVLRKIDRRDDPILCEECPQKLERSVSARRILSPTPTTFVAAGGRKL